MTSRCDQLSPALSVGGCKSLRSRGCPELSQFASAMEPSVGERAGSEMHVPDTRGVAMEGFKCSSKAHILN